MVRVCSPSQGERINHREDPMLKRDPSCGFRCRYGGFFGSTKLYRFCVGHKYASVEIKESIYQQILESQQHTPVIVMLDSTSRKRWWMFRNEFYWEDEGFSQTEVKALILDRTEQKQRKLQRAIARVSQSESEPATTRQPIPDEVKMLVWQRDGGRCVKCGSQENLEFDHIIPVSKGGSNTARNLQLLCERCNRSKGGDLT